MYVDCGGFSLSLLVLHFKGKIIELEPFRRLYTLPPPSFFVRRRKKEREVEDRRGS